MTRRKSATIAVATIGTLGIIVCSARVLIHRRREAELADLSRRYEKNWHEPNSILSDIAAFGDAGVPYLEALARRTERVAPMYWLAMVPGLAAEEAYARLVVWLHTTSILDDEIMDWEKLPWRDAYSGSLEEMTRRNPYMWQWVLDAQAKDGIIPEWKRTVDVAIEQLVLLPPSPTRRKLLLSWTKATRGRAFTIIWDHTGDCELAATLLEADWVVPYRSGNLVIDDPRMDMATIANNKVFRAEVKVDSEFYLRIHVGRLTEDDLHLIASWLRKSQHLYGTRRQRDDTGKEYGLPEVVFLPNKDKPRMQFPGHAVQ